MGLSPVRRTVGPLPPVSSVKVKFADPVRRFVVGAPKPMKLAVSAAPVPVESMEIVASDPVPATVKSAALNERTVVGLTETEPSDSFTVSGGETGPDIHITISVVVGLPYLQHAIPRVRVEV